MVILHRLGKFTLPISDLVNIYILYIRSVLEQSAVVWNSSITKGEQLEIERVQKCALRIILKENYSSYENSLKICGLDTLKTRRNQLSLSFAIKCTKNAATKSMFPEKDIRANTRFKENMLLGRVSKTPRGGGPINLATFGHEYVTPPKTATYQMYPP